MNKQEFADWVDKQKKEMKEAFDAYEVRVGFGSTATNILTACLFACILAFAIADPSKSTITLLGVMLLMFAFKVFVYYQEEVVYKRLERNAKLSAMEAFHMSVQVSAEEKKKAEEKKEKSPDPQGGSPVGTDPQGAEKN